jgi:hypothetical protein
MRVIFSRKGFDSQYGKVPSPILNGRPYSIPIPATKMPSATRFCDVKSPGCEIVEDLTKKQILASSFCHLDPDIEFNSLDRDFGWHGTFGQTSAASGHLDRMGVSEGDLFLFFGLFRSVCNQCGSWKYVGEKHHRIFGWLQIGQIIHLDKDFSAVLKQYPWLKAHPHVQPGWERERNNRLYVAASSTNIGTKNVASSGSGIFSKGYKLTAGGQTPSIWKMPDWINTRHNGPGMSYHPPSRWLENGLLKSAAKGQEFVVPDVPTDEGIKWLHDLFELA